MQNTAQKNEMSEIIEKIRVADPINDEELKKALVFYSDLEEKLRLLGERFHFAWRSAFDTLHTLQGYEQARKDRR
jgi:hypothetical protein